MNNMPVKGVNIVMRNKAGEYLLHMRDNNPGIPFPLMWDLFGGGIDGEETPVESAIRELQEELEWETSTEDFTIVPGSLQRTGEHSAEEFIVIYKKPVQWQDFTVLHEGAGMAFFKKADITHINAEPLVLDMIERSEK